MESRFGKIQLPDFLLVDLFRDNLVIHNDTSDSNKLVPLKKEKPQTTDEIPIQNLPEIIEEIVTKKWFLGDNSKQITIMVKDNEAVYLRDEWLNFLTALLGACKLNIGDVAIVNYTNTPVMLPALNEQLKPTYFLLFDIAAQDIQLPFTVPNYQLQKFGNTTFLLAPSLAMMQGNTETVKLEKSKLWLSLKKMFKI